MIEIIDNKLFHLFSNKASYVFAVGNNGELLHLHYGRKIHCGCDAFRALSQKWSNPNGCSVVNDIDNKICPDDEKYEISSVGYGDHRTPMVAIRYEDGSTTSEFTYVTNEVLEYKEVESLMKKTNLPCSYFNPSDGEAKALKVTLKDRTEEIFVDLYYTVYENSDVFTRFAVLTNKSKKAVSLESLYSLQLDMDADNVKVSSFHGDWGREMEKCDTVLTGGIFVNESRTGFSSNHSNPFVMISESAANETQGEVIATNLVYSGNHREVIEIGGISKCRILTGINPDFLSWCLAPGESFTAPEAVFTYSTEGFRGISRNMHEFVRCNIVRGEWKKKERPVLLNSWEAAYFKISEGKLLKLARAAKDVGVELFVMDDGWFGKRNEDNSSLGDWYDNKDKLPGGINGLSKKIHELGLQFGIWVEPEMVNADSDLYRSHPDWTIKNPSRHHAEGRNQMLLDLSKPVVQEFIINTMSDVFERGEVDYVKWDMNRNFSDFFSQGADSSEQGKLSHKYIMGLYRVMRELTEKFPHILFEGCASGGNRFDLGILSFFPQIWASDDTDAIARCTIQNGYSYGYPQSTYTAHVSATPNHQTLRNTPLETRFAVASMGVLGLELNLCDLPSDALDKIKTQLELYKKWRNVLQYGDIYRLGGSVVKNTVTGLGMGFLSSRFDTSVTQNIIVSKDKKSAMGFIVNGLVKPDSPHTIYKATGLLDEAEYHFTNIFMKHDIHRMGDLVNTMAPIHIKQDSLVHNVLSKFVKLDGEKEDYVVSGAILNNAGINLSQMYAGTGYGENTRLYSDFEARIYLMEEV